MTPEGRVKKAISKVLARYGADIYVFMSVPYGYGKSTLDYVCCVEGCFFAIEAKAPGQAPTPRQDFIITQIRAAGGTVFVIDGVDKTQDLEAFLQRIKHGPSTALVAP